MVSQEGQIEIQNIPKQVPRRLMTFSTLLAEFVTLLFIIYIIYRCIKTRKIQKYNETRQPLDNEQSSNSDDIRQHLQDL